MKIERKTYRDGNLLPDVYNCLKHLPDNTSYHQDHNERHPFAIYNLSIQKVLQSLDKLLNEAGKIYTSLFDATGELNYRLGKLPDLQKDLLHSLQSYIDDCYRILKVLYPFTPTNGKFVEGWLEKVKHPAYPSFKAAISDYRNSFAPIVNKIKHNGGQIRPIMMCSKGTGVVLRTPNQGIQIPQQNARIIGYFLEGVQPNGRIGPDCDIHPDGKTAISLNRDLRYHFANIYRIGHHLRSAVSLSIKSCHGIRLSYPSAVQEPVSQYNIESIAEQISKLPILFFQDECTKATPEIRFSRSTTSTELLIDTSGAPPMTWDGEMMIYFELQTDGVSTKYQLPYK
ncbi:hypothetical protein [Nodosilinea nodulosa]|uniref:hypothetical protein n=1 Tax=Nodosilinea nodulosa TaxID=416001 RepID=UPI0008FBAF9E|nr:hypothetical protein [Nodosilinea nodulosa]